MTYTEDELKPMKPSEVLEAKLAECFEDLSKVASPSGCPYLLSSWTAKEEKEAALWWAELMAKAVEAGPEHRNYERAKAMAMYLGKMTLHGTATHDAFHVVGDVLLTLLEEKMEEIDALRTRNKTLQAMVDAMSSGGSDGQTGQGRVPGGAGDDAAGDAGQAPASDVGAGGVVGEREAG